MEVTEKLQLKKLEGKIEIVTGLHIGAGNDELRIGGIDNPIVKDFEGNPYIPGSSLKGKIRSLLEISEGIVSDGKSSTIESDSIIPILFGSMPTREGKGEVTRLIFRDAFLSDESKNKIEERLLPATEVKAETAIDRVSGTAMKGSLRYTERTIPGLLFDFEIVMRIFANDDEQKFLEMLKKGLRLLEYDALGGSGSRGYGKIKFRDLTFDGQAFNLD